jgi:hypothetical protein
MRQQHVTFTCAATQYDFPVMNLSIHPSELQKISCVPVAFDLFASELCKICYLLLT